MERAQGPRRPLATSAWAPALCSAPSREGDSRDSHTLMAPPRRTNQRQGGEHLSRVAEQE